MNNNTPSFGVSRSSLMVVQLEALYIRKQWLLAVDDVPPQFWNNKLFYTLGCYRAVLGEGRIIIDAP
jgi:hypothetical protein